VRRYPLAVTAALAVLAATAIVTAAQAEPVPRQTPAPQKMPLASGHTYTVTLLTGDKVTVETQPAGCPRVTVQPAAHGGVVTRSCGADGHVRVVPAELAGQVGKALDPALFDVTTLIQQGYDDAHTAELPVIVKDAPNFAASPSPMRKALQRPRGLTSIGATSGRLGKAARPDLGGVQHVWLDRRVRVLQADAPVAGNLTQIGAPDAWAEGYTGRGVKVAVLDTGIDATHPDLAGKVVQAEDFTGGGDPADHFGHGTHVAATIAGTGAASHGRYRGVAPDAQLYIGKVLDDTGSGTDSMVIAGMEWAAPLAGVVNLSLGGPLSDDGSDPTSAALDALTDRYGTLFVVAAGNDGPEAGYIGSPARAASALTVGAVDRTDTLAEFSSRGPVEGSRTVKPEIDGPGVDIVSARAAGTGIGTLVDRYYTMLSGTSMATPHVAGAAALMRQAHPQWTPGRVKSALTDQAHAVKGGDLYERGNGRVDIPPALHATVLAGEAVLHLGTAAYPQRTPLSRAATWTNTAAQATTLRLGLTVTDRAGKPVPARLSATSVAIAAGGQGSATVTVDPTGLNGSYEGILTARSGDAEVRTPVSFFVEPPTFDVTVTATPLPGTPDGAFAMDALVMNLDDPSLFQDGVYNSDTGTATIRVPAGRYSIIGDVYDDTAGASRSALAGTAQVTVDKPTTVLLDGAHARPVTAKVTGVDTKSQFSGLSLLQTGRFGYPMWFGAWAWDDDAARDAVYTTPFTDATVGEFAGYETFGLRSPAAGPSPFLYDLFRALPNGVPADPSYVLGAAERDRLARIEQRFDPVGERGLVPGHKRYGISPEGVLVFEDLTDNVPATRVDYVTPGVPYMDESYAAGDGELAYLLLDEESPIVYPPGSTQRKAWFAQPLRPDWHSAPGATSACAPQPISRTRGNLHVDLAALVDQHERYNCLAFFWPVDPPALSLLRDGARIGTAAGFTADFPIPAGRGTYTIRLDQDNSDVLTHSTHITTDWTFRSTGKDGLVPLLAVDYALARDGSPSSFDVRQVIGAPAQRITGLTVTTSTDGGKTWTPAQVRRTAPAAFTATLPVSDNLSLRVTAAGSDGSAIDQTIMQV